MVVLYAHDTIIIRTDGFLGTEGDTSTVLYENPGGYLTKTEPPLAVQSAL